MDPQISNLVQKYQKVHLETLKISRNWHMTLYHRTTVWRSIFFTHTNFNPSIITILPKTTEQGNQQHHIENNRLNKDGPCQLNRSFMVSSPASDVTSARFGQQKFSLHCEIYHTQYLDVNVDSVEESTSASTLCRLKHPFKGFVKSKTQNY